MTNVIKNNNKSKSSSTTLLGDYLDVTNKEQQSKKKKSFNNNNKMNDNPASSARSSNVDDYDYDDDATTQYDMTSRTTCTNTHHNDDDAMTYHTGITTIKANNLKDHDHYHYIDVSNSNSSSHYDYATSPEQALTKAASAAANKSPVSVNAKRQDSPSSTEITAPDKHWATSSQGSTNSITMLAYYAHAATRLQVTLYFELLVQYATPDSLRQVVKTVQDLERFKSHAHRHTLIQEMILDKKTDTHLQFPFVLQQDQKKDPSQVIIKPKNKWRRMRLGMLGGTDQQWKYLCDKFKAALKKCEWMAIQGYKGSPSLGTLLQQRLETTKTTKLCHSGKVTTTTNPDPDESEATDAASLRNGILYL